ncbi:arabinose transporter [Noviherbaspirillum pedocola]|uniref:Arabinose transporter n=1 Tax=Noviherbaspirillum pedocola TaxID=2801341 RepID=A0A934T434_9BURK|nr:arabinose transporter [Noviherbaspirillum pedocola]MBK4738518.1 arabinose transporter [Noviherbaspirillum pedocola]
MSTSGTTRPLTTTPSSFGLTILPVLAFTLIAFMVTGIAMPVLALHVHERLGMGTVMVGLVTGAQFGMALVSRVWAGSVSDTTGAKRAVVIGMLSAVGAGLLYLVSLRFTQTPMLSAAVLLVGRALLGAAESFVITGALGWGLVLAGPKDTGKAIAWIGMAMYVAFAIGAPLGTFLYGRFGFASIGVATAFFPLLGLILVAKLQGIVPPARPRPSFVKVIGAVILPGAGLALASLGFGAITTFISLLFAKNGWSDGWMAFTGFSGAFVIARLFFGHLPDTFGGARVALVSLVVEAAGQAMIWSAPSPLLAIVGATLTGFGYSLVYPGFGIEAVRKVGPGNGGLAMGAFTAFLDLALGISGPTLGWVASGAGVPSIFLVSAVIVLCATAVAGHLLRMRRKAI